MEFIKLPLYTRQDSNIVLIRTSEVSRGHQHTNLQVASEEQFVCNVRVPLQSHCRVFDQEGS